MTDKIKVLMEKGKKIRKNVLELAKEHNEGHIASAFSIIEILIVLYEEILNPSEDRFILSKGHGCLSLYPILKDKGKNPKIRTHPDIDTSEGITCTTGSLGHGLPIGVGMAFAKKFKKENGRVFVLVGDGECQEGTIWESLNLAKRHKLDNLTVIVDNNKLQALTTLKEVMDETNLKSKFEAFGCYTVEVQGHDFQQLLREFSVETIKKGMPKVIIAHTVKGKGLSFMEHDPKWHSRIPEDELLKQAYKELE